MADNLPPVIDKFVVPETAVDGEPFIVEFAAHGGNARIITSMSQALDTATGLQVVSESKTTIQNPVATQVVVEDPLGQATIRQIDPTHWEITP